MAEPNSSSKFKKVAVFCGASSGNNPAYVEAAKALANEMVKRKIGLVYGGELLYVAIQALFGTPCCCYASAAPFSRHPAHYLVALIGFRRECGPDGCCG